VNPLRLGMLSLAILPIGTDGQSLLVEGSWLQRYANGGVGVVGRAKSDLWRIRSEYKSFSVRRYPWAAQSVPQ
jgi:hypothetical protein